MATAVLCAAGCSPSTRIVETWRDPELTAPLPPGRTLVVALGEESGARDTAEDTLVQRIGAERAVAGHRYLAEDERRRDKLRYRLSKGDINYVVTLAVLGTRTLVSAQDPFGPAEPFYGYYDRAGGFLGDDPAVPGEEQVYRVETRVYRVNGERLVWRAVSDTVDPDDTRSAVLDIANAVGAEMRKQKLIQ